MLHKFLVRYLLLTLAIAAFGELAASSLPLANANTLTFEPPAGSSAPKTTVGGGRRGSNGQCLTDRSLTDQDSQQTAIKNKQSLSQQLIPLLPPSKFGLTVSSTPQIFAYIPKTNAIAVEFTLENEQGKGIARKRLDLTKTPSIVKVQFDQTPLEIGKDYKWLLSVVCEAGDPEDIFVEGLIRRIAPPQTLIQKLEKASAIAKVYSYAELGIWYEAIAELATLRISQPDNTAIKSDWASLLKSTNLEELVNAPIKN